MRSNLPDFSSQCSCGGGWALRHYAFRDRNDHQPPGSSYVSDTAIF